MIWSDLAAFVVVVVLSCVVLCEAGRQVRRSLQIMRVQLTTIFLMCENIGVNEKTAVSNRVVGDLGYRRTKSNQQEFRIPNRVNFQQTKNNVVKKRYHFPVSRMNRTIVSPTNKTLRDFCPLHDADVRVRTPTRS